MNFTKVLDLQIFAKALGLEFDVTKIGECYFINIYAENDVDYELNVTANDSSYDTFMFVYYKLKARYRAMLMKMKTLPF